jgi:predicted DNA binding protein
VPPTREYRNRSGGKQVQLYDTDPERGPPRDRLTARQRETLRLAHERGYFEIPREVTLDDLADELGVSNQAVSERLRRGCTHVIGDLFG